MCGRLTLQTAPGDLVQFLFSWTGIEQELADYVPRYNITPTQQLDALVGDGSSKHLTKFRWGLIPAWADDLNIGNRMINARRETLREKRSFSNSLAKRRCLVIADGYYEWKAIQGRTKQAYWITPQSPSVMLLAGLWDINHRATGEPIHSCTLITTQANPTMSTIHDRMPMPLDSQSADYWLNPACSAEEAYAVLRPVDDRFFNYQPVSARVNNPRNDDLDCIKPVTPESPINLFEGE